MIEYLEAIDRNIVLTINSYHSPFCDELMWWISARITWIPLYIIIFYLVYQKVGLKFAFLFLISVVLTIIVADMTSVYLLKETIQRYRPSHNLLIKDSLHLYKSSKDNYYAGGTYGFVSSHATNFFVIATSFCLVFFKEYKTTSFFLFFIALLVCYSRIYLGVHYLTDILAGAIFGIICAMLSYKFIWKKIYTGGK